MTEDDGRIRGRYWPEYENVDSECERYFSVRASLRPTATKSDVDGPGGVELSVKQMCCLSSKATAKKEISISATNYLSKRLSLMVPFSALYFILFSPPFAVLTNKLMNKHASE